MIRTRAQHEDEIKRMLANGMPTSAQVDSMPLGLKEPKAFDVRPGGAVWVVYAGGKPDPGQGDLDGEHREGWIWSCLVLSKEYRSSKLANAGALDLLEQVDEVLSGAEIECREVVRLGDKLLALPEGKGLVGYEVQFRVEIFRDRK